VTLKERRPLVLMFRETPLHRGYIRLMDLATSSGATIFPPVPALYTLPKTIDDLVDHSARRALDQVGVSIPGTQRWDGRELPPRAHRHGGKGVNRP
jgi:4-hydroxy-3-polyprenylbenzoate decarboxylase